MSDIINLRNFKKQKARDAKETAAEQNRILFGRTKTEKDFARQQQKKDAQFLDANRLEPKTTAEKKDET